MVHLITPMLLGKFTNQWSSAKSNAVLHQPTLEIHASELLGLFASARLFY